MSPGEAAAIVDEVFGCMEADWSGVSSYEIDRSRIQAAQAMALDALKLLDGSPIDPLRLAMAMDKVDEEDDRLGVVGRGRKVDRIIFEYARIAGKP